MLCVHSFSLLLQPHNILLSSKENSAPIKIADFGVAAEIDNDYITSGTWLVNSLFHKKSCHTV